MPTIIHLKQLMLNSNVALRYNFISTNLGCAENLACVQQSCPAIYSSFLEKKKKLLLDFGICLQDDD